MEETKIVVKPQDIIGIRFNMHDWYVAFWAEYLSGEAESDQDENSEVKAGLQHKEYEGSLKHAPNLLFGL